MNPLIKAIYPCYQAKDKREAKFLNAFRLIFSVVASGAGIFFLFLETHEKADELDCERMNFQLEQAPRFDCTATRQNTTFEHCDFSIALACLSRANQTALMAAQPMGSWFQRNPVIFAGSISISILIAVVAMLRFCRIRSTPAGMPRERFFSCQKKEGQQDQSEYGIPMMSTSP